MRLISSLVLICTLSLLLVRPSLAEEVQKENAGASKDFVLNYEESTIIDPAIIQNSIKQESIKVTKEIDVAEKKKADPKAEKDKRYETYNGYIAQSFESIEEDEWSAALVNIKSVSNYFLAEARKYPQEKEINVYFGLTEVFVSYIETGIEIDKDVDVPDLAKIKKMSEENQKKSNSLSKKSHVDYLDASFKLIDQYIEDDLLYVKEAEKYEKKDEI